VIDTRLASAETKIREAIDWLNQAEIEAQTAQQAALESRHVAQRLISTYRTENAAVRDTPAPCLLPAACPNSTPELTGLPPLDCRPSATLRLAEAAELCGKRPGRPRRCCAPWRSRRSRTSRPTSPTAEADGERKVARERNGRARGRPSRRSAILPRAAE
jgi:hypothetical protein